MMTMCNLCIFYVTLIKRVLYIYLTKNLHILHKP